MFVYGGMLWTGYKRRKGTWTRRSWIFFIGALLMSFVLIGVGLVLAMGVESAAGFSAMLAFMFGGFLSTAFLILSFARGNPDQQFPFLPKYEPLGFGTQEMLIDLRDRLHAALVAVGFELVAERHDPPGVRSWQRDYVRDGKMVRLAWNSEAWDFTLKGGKPFRMLASRRPALSESEIAEFIACVNRADAE